MEIEAAPVLPQNEIIWFGKRIRLPPDAMVELRGSVEHVTFSGGTIELRTSSGAAEQRTWVDAGGFHSLRRITDDTGAYECAVTADTDQTLAIGAQSCASLANLPSSSPDASIPRPIFAADLGVDFESETMFHDCTNPEGAGLAVSGGLGLRPSHQHGFGVRAGASIAGLAGGDHAQRRDQIWAGPTAILAVPTRAQIAITAFVTMSQYSLDPMAPAAIGGGVSFDIWAVKRSTFHLGLRLLGDREGGIFGGFTIGWALLR
jgi:hypothetical protein